jgi:ABC-2 type transport system ATP-binding protein
MDEPTQGLDPELAREFLEMIRSLKGEGITILLSSHLLHQVQAVCDRVGLFSRGRMVLHGTVPELAQKVMGGAYLVRIQADGSAEKLQKSLRELPQAIQVRLVDGNRYEVEAQGDVRHEAAEAVIKAGGRLLGLNIEHQSLDEIYTRYFEEAQHAKTA